MEESWKKHQAVLSINGILCGTELFLKTNNNQYMANFECLVGQQ
jgi:hypothetical protein